MTKVQKVIKYIAIAFAIETNSNQITYRQKEDTLVIEEKVHNWWRVNEVGNVIIYVPKEVTLENVKIDAGAGDVSIQVAELSNVNLDMGIGELSLVAKLKGNNEFDFGVGRAELELKGVLDDYKIRVDKGIGDVTISDTHMESGTYYGNGETTIEIDGGIGAIEIDFAGVEEKTEYTLDK